ncbi:DUF1176 domain-containing protein [Aquidulcibacter sp.]|jgi:hypothetical protein|uniref:DUF1176 domain-containing protein n=1 Tax=Aquidulcibacter sp. TaxID=2052990 RepID=UPI0028AA17E2|nr:DUF1176 domain-containing protein [Aquidulcibacter sp.]
MNIHPAKPLLLSFLLTGLFVMPAQAQSVPKDYRDWSVSCSNIKTCTTVSISGLNEMGVSSTLRGVPADSEMGWLWFEIEAGPTAKPKIIYSAMYTSAQPTPKNGSLRIIGRDGRSLRNGIFVLTADESGASQLSSADVDRFIELAQIGRAVLYSNGGSRKSTSFASLSGFVAALRAIEVTQGRTGTAGAWVDVGRIARERIPPAPATPRINAVAFTKLPIRTSIPKAVLERRKAECDDSERYDPGGQGIEGFSLGKGRILWSIPCGAGAYNAWSKFYLQDGRTSVIPYPFPGPESTASDEDAHSLVNVSIEPETGQISTFSKGRGIADCGTAETYTWDGTRFVLTTLLEMNACGGLMPDYWPQRVKTEVVPPAKARR